MESAKKTIESLHQQLMELEKSESLSRAREQHENVVMATKKRYDEDITRLKQKLDDVNNSLMWKVVCCVYCMAISIMESACFVVN